MKKIFILVLVLSLTLLVVGCSKENVKKTNNKSATVNKIVGNYKLKEASFGEKVYSSEKLKKELGRSVKLVVKNNNLAIMTTTYYTTDGNSNDSLEKFYYDDKNFNDYSDHNFNIYMYEVSGKDLVLINKSGDEKLVFTK